MNLIEAYAKVTENAKKAGKNETFDPDRIPAGLTDSKALSKVVWPYAWGLTFPDTAPES